ncbi:MFS transporter [Microbacterium oleivorans]|uniref:ABC transporter permease n=1 Tax=Microbacterium oleivorans TaxID=273677 RepID=A0A177K804_9MICO|nr:MFS transporter [Microbacterium oleivorans]OAH48731.1 ABC transporter permease [Microbacterium oleivorans]
MTSPDPLAVRRGRILALVGIVLLAFSLRSAVASLSPLFDAIGEDFVLPAAVLGLIGTVPPLCFAVFGLLASGFERRFGLERTTLVALGAVALGLVARAAAGDAYGLLLGSALVFAGVGVGNVLLPALVKKYFPDRIGLMTTVYSTMMAISTFVPPLVAVPVADAAGWRTSLGLWAVFALAGLAPWIVLALRARRAALAEVDLEPVSTRVFGRMWRLPTAWALAVTFFVSSAVAYTSFAWLPKILVDTAGVTPQVAGTLLSLFALIGLPASLVVPVLVARRGVVLPLFIVASASGVLGAGGLLVAPASAPWLWVALLGILPLLFPLVLTSVGLRTRTHDATVALSSFAQSLGYGVTMLMPIGVGLIHDATGSWTVPLVMLLAISLLAVPAGVVIARRKTVEQEWEQRHGSW